MVVKRNLRKPRKQRGWRRQQCEWEKCSPGTRATGQGLLRAHCLPCKMTGLLVLGFVVIVLNGETNMRISGSSPRAGAVAHISLCWGAGRDRWMLRAHRPANLDDMACSRVSESLFQQDGKQQRKHLRFTSSCHRSMKGAHLPRDRHRGSSSRPSMASLGLYKTSSQNNQQQNPNQAKQKARAKPGMCLYPSTWEAEKGRPL